MERILERSNVENVLCYQNQGILPFSFFILEPSYQIGEAKGIR